MTSEFAYFYRSDIPKDELLHAFVNQPSLPMFDTESQAKQYAAGVASQNKIFFTRDSFACPPIAKVSIDVHTTTTPKSTSDHIPEDKQIQYIQTTAIQEYLYLSLHVNDQHYQHDLQNNENTESNKPGSTWCFLY